MSLRARLLLVVTVLAAVGLAIANVATYAALRSFLVERVDRTLAASAASVDQALGHMGPRARQDLDHLATVAPGVFIEVRAPGGEPVWSGILARRGEQEQLALPALPATLPAGSPFVAGSRDGESEFRVLARPLPGGATLVVAAPLDDVTATLRRLATIEVLVSLAVLAAIVSLGLWLVRLGLRPLGGIEEAAAAIGAGDLGRRIEGAGPRTEVGRLGLALNAMLAQIEGAFAERTASEERLRRFVADASHELRTPLSAVQAYAELFERGARARPDDLARAMAGIEREAQRMGALVDELLLLARLDQGRPLARRAVDLPGLASDAVDAARALEPERPVELRAPDRLEVTGDPDRLRQVLDNLLANVRAHTPPAAAATVSVGRENGSAVIEVADAGPGLSEEEAARVFERFYRADPSRTRAGGGSGLGLAIVAAIAEAHGGSATVASEPGRGARFRVLLPLARQAPGAGGAFSA